MNRYRTLFERLFQQCNIYFTRMPGSPSPETLCFLKRSVMEMARPSAPRPPSNLSVTSRPPRGDTPGLSKMRSSVVVDYFNGIVSHLKWLSLVYINM